MPISRNDITRRDVFAGAAALTLAGCAREAARPIPGTLLGAAALGHRLRDRELPPIAATQRAPVVVAGGGIAGLSAAYALRRAGMKDVLMLEMDAEVGGTSRAGRNSVSAFPWGAHYLPLPRPDCAPVVGLLEDLGVVRDRDAAGLPVFDEYCLSADPQERLWMLGRWQEGLVPHLGASEAERAQFAAFFAEMHSLKSALGSDGRPLFAIPVDASSRDAEWRALDRMTMAQWLRDRGWDSPKLAWYVNYCCRDDYGMEMQATSAWAGIHYFAARNGAAANAEPDTVLTWPEGNGYLVNELARRGGAAVRSQALVTRVARRGTGAVVEYLDATANMRIRVECDAAIVCLPRFVAARVVEGLGASEAEGFSYAPWMVANVTVSRMPEGRGHALAWDNVIYNSASLGYVVATHQRLEQVRNETVLTYYWPLSHLEPAAARRWALDRSLGDWQHDVASEMLRVHPELTGRIANIDVCVWGHGMVRPTPGFLFGDARARRGTVEAPIYLAHSDLGGIAIFEEAYCGGFEAGRAAARRLRA